jgi:type II secretory pathway component PulF
MNIELFSARFSFRRTNNRAEFYEDMAAALRDGVDIVSFLQKRASRAKQMKDPMGPLYRVWVHRMDSTSFSGALRGDIPAEECMVISAAENSASLDNDLEFLASTVRGVAGMKKALVGAMIVPTIAFCLVAGMIYGFSSFFVPLLVAIIPPDKWPTSGRMLKAVADFVMDYGVILLFLIVGIVVGFIVSLNRLTGPLRRTLDEWPVYSLFRAHNGAVTLIVLAAMMGAGKALVESLESIEKHSSRWTRWHINSILRRLDIMGGDPGKSFDTGLLPRRILNRVIDRAERSDFGSALRNIGFTVLDNVKKEVEAKAKTINVIMLVVAGFAIGFMFWGFLDTVYSIQGSLKKF